MALDDLYTRGDLVEFVTDRYQAQGDRNIRFVRMACRDAYRDIPKFHTWKYLRRDFTFLTNEPYDTGTIAFDFTGGTYERQITLTTGTWPTWAASGVIRIDDTNYPVATRESNSVITLGADSNPGADVAASTAYQLFQQDYLIPRNAGTIWRVTSASGPRELLPIDPSAQPATAAGIATPGLSQWYSALGTAGIRNLGRRAMRLFPPPNDAKVVAMSYDAYPRPWVMSTPYTLGTVAISSGGTTLTLTSGTWPTGIEGCLVRLSADSAIQALPTGPDGDFPAAFASVVRSRTSDTVVELWTAADKAYSGVTFTLDDPLEIETSAMWPWLKAEACARYLETSGASGESVGKARFEARERLAYAREADRTTTEPVDIYGLADPILSTIYGSYLAPTYTPPV